MQQTNDFVVFDLETQRSFDEVGGRQNLQQLGISVAVLYDSRNDETVAFREPELDRLVEYLQTAPLVVGFNVLKFDYPVLQPYTDFRLNSLPTVDLLHHIHQRLGWRVSLDNLGRTTLKAPKSASGLQAIAWFREGEWQKLIKYCEDDVLLTRDLYLFGKQHGYVKFWDGKQRFERKLAVNW